MDHERKRTLLISSLVCSMKQHHCVLVNTVGINDEYRYELGNAIKMSNMITTVVYQCTAFTVDQHY